MKSFVRLLLAATTLLAGALPAAAQSGAASPPPDRGAGIAVAIGGALKYDNDAVWQRLVDLAGGKGARFAVFATAAGDPNKAAAPIVDALNRHGAVAEHIPVAPRLAGSDYRAAARDPALVARVTAARGIYFAGGAQERITQALYDESGRPTPVLDAIWSVYRAGGVVAGSSAGAAIMSTTMFRDAQDVMSVLKSGLAEGREIDRGLGFVGPDVFVDQHFLKRGRLGRMLPLMQQKGYKLGVGVDENTAAIFVRDTVEIIGYKGALVADLTAATSDPRLGEFNIRKVRLSYLDHGDRYDLKTRVATPAPEKLKDLKVDPNAADFKPYFSEDAFYPDILGDTTVVNLMSNLIDNRQREAVGLAFGAAESPKGDLGFEFRFSKGPDSIGWYTGAFGGEDYSVFNIYLDVVPVRLARPLYRPLDPR
jgi:cyanophycinase